MKKPPMKMRSIGPGMQAIADAMKSKVNPKQGFMMKKKGAKK